jgi:hypothetical protein
VGKLNAALKEQNLFVGRTLGSSADLGVAVIVVISIVRHRRLAGGSGSALGPRQVPFLPGFNGAQIYPLGILLKRIPF